jgi:hypothetical protein
VSIAKFKTLSLVALLIAAIPAFGQEPQVVALTFQAWKDQQVLEAQNQILRISARLNQLKNGKASGTESKETANLPSNRLKKVGEADSLALAEKDLKRAQESMETATGLQFENYIDIYLPSLQDQPEAAAKLIEKLSKEELMEITKALLRKGSRTSDARRNAGRVTGEGLIGSFRSRGS